MRLGYQPVNISTQFYGSAVHPAGASPLGYAASNRTCSTQKNRRVSYLSFLLESKELMNTSPRIDIVTKDAY